MKMYVVITDRIGFAKGQMNHTVSLFDHDPCISHWTTVGTVDIDLSGVDKDGMIEEAVADIDIKIQEAKAAFSIAMGELEEQKNQLLALPAPGATK